MGIPTPAFAFLEALGGSEMLIIMMVVLLLFGGKRLPEFARGIGRTMREIRKATGNVEHEIKKAFDETLPSLEPDRDPPERIMPPAWTRPPPPPSSAPNGPRGRPTEPTGK